MNSESNDTNNKEEFPLVSILMAVYKPNEKWLIEQLISLNNQTYENLELYIYDDCPEFPTNENLFKEYITNFKYTLIRGKVNKGSNIAFEELTKVGTGEYFAYCDQDDIWESDKISIMVDKFEEKDVTLVCCDLSIIDENSIKTHDSIRDIRKRIVYKSGYNLAEELLMINFVTGCAMLVRRYIALKSVPFLDEILHDQWLAIISASEGKIEFVDKQLVRYRQHSCNQTGILKSIYDKQSYYKNRIDMFINRFQAYKKRFENNKDINDDIQRYLKWLNARKNYSNHLSINDLKIMIKYRNFHRVSVIVECVLPFIPDFIFKYIIMLTKKGIL